MENGKFDANVEIDFYGGWLKSVLLVKWKRTFN